MIHNVDPQFSQWDVGRIVSISDSDATHIHFANQGDSKAVIMEITDGSVKVPDYLLQTGKNVIAYAVKDGVTLESKSFPVRKRERPENYIYEDDQRNYIYALVANAETAVANANAATNRTTDASSKANLATSKANEASVSATVAADAATEAAQKANDAAAVAMETAKGLADVVTYKPQTLTPEEQAQARKNTGAVSAEEVNALIDAKLSVIVNAEEVAY